MNTELSHQAILQLLYQVWELRDFAFETWLGVTFAAILATYFSSEYLSKFLRRLILVLFVLSSVMFLMGWMTLGSHLAFYVEMLDANKLAKPPVLFSWAAPLKLALMFFGSIATAFFIVLYRREQP